MKKSLIYIVLILATTLGCAKRKCDGKRGIKVPMGTLEKRSERSIR